MEKYKLYFSEMCKGNGFANKILITFKGKVYIYIYIYIYIYMCVSLQLHVQNAVSPQRCVRKLRISLVLFNFLDCKFRL